MQRWSIAECEKTREHFTAITLENLGRAQTYQSPDDSCRNDGQYAERNGKYSFGLYIESVFRFDSPASSPQAFVSHFLFSLSE